MMRFKRTGLLLLMSAMLSIVSADDLVDDSANDLSRAAISIIDPSVIYDGSYRAISYPLGDVAPTHGVCSDVVIRAYRELGYDLQQLVHEDMKRNFSRYPSQRMWGLKSTDRNIDHRRVPNLEVFFARKGEVLPITQKSEDYRAGDIVSWRLNNGLPHIGIVIDEKASSGRPMIVHNIGRGQIAEDVLFHWEIVGHYRFK